MDFYNIDSKGVKRGVCLSCDECPEFEWQKESPIASCNYCGCLPTKHFKCIEEKNSMPLDSGSLDDSSLLNSNNSSVVIIEPGASTSQETNEQNSPDTEGEDVFEITETVDFSRLIPTKFPDDIQNAIDKKIKLTESQKNCIIRMTAKNMCNADLDQSFIILEISTLLCKKFPEDFKSRFGDPHEQTRCRLKNSCKYYKSKNNNSAKPTSNDKQTNPKKSVRAKHELRLTRKARMTSTKKLNAEQILQKYPALKKNDMLLWELAEFTNLTVETLRENWLQALPQIIKALKINTNNFDDNGKTVATLLYLPKLFSKAKESGKILECYPSGTPISSTIPEISEPPKLIAISNGPFNDLELMCYVDSKPIFQAKGFEAVLLLVAVYWIFQVHFPQHAKQQFAFISIAVLRDAGIKDIRKDILSKVTLTTSLKLCGLLTEEEN